MSERIFVICDDLLFWARIHAAAEALGRPVSRITDGASLEAALKEGGVRRVLVDLDTRSVDALDAGRRWKAQPDPPDLVGFGSHVDEGLLERAREAGYDTVVPNRVFHRRVSELLA